MSLETGDFNEWRNCRFLLPRGTPPQICGSFCFQGKECEISLTEQFGGDDGFWLWNLWRLGFWGRQLVEIQKKHRIIRPGGSVLDLGCAPGAFLQVWRIFLTLLALLYSEHIWVLLGNPMGAYRVMGHLSLPSESWVLALQCDWFYRWCYSWIVACRWLAKIWALWRRVAGLLELTLRCLFSNSLSVKSLNPNPCREFFWLTCLPQIYRGVWSCFPSCNCTVEVTQNRGKVWSCRLCHNSDDKIKYMSCLFKEVSEVISFPGWIQNRR